MTPITTAACPGVPACALSGPSVWPGSRTMTTPPARAVLRGRSRERPGSGADPPLHALPPLAPAAARGAECDRPGLSARPDLVLGRPG